MPLSPMCPLPGVLASFYTLVPGPSESPLPPFSLRLSFRNTYGGTVGDSGLILAGAVLSAVPTIILFIVFQRYFLEGVSFGGSKG
ncbi:MAG: hypothetical protein WD273_14940 [Trueperaceae bacterium]